MKKLYWRPQRISAKVIILLAVVSMLSLLLVEVFKVREKQRYYREKLVASQLADKAFIAIKEARIARRIPINSTTDPMRSGLVGDLISDVTTNTGVLAAKQTSVNPNFAAVFVHLLKRAGVEPGDHVALGFSGSFPALNITVLAAIKAIKAKPLLISSVGSSQWGANHPDFMFTDMERELRRRGIFSYKSLAVSLGGVDDLATGLSPKGQQALVDAITRNKLKQLDAKDVNENLRLRMALYREKAGGGEIKAYVNVGGGTTSVGTRVGKRLFKPGLNRGVPRGAADIDSVMTRFARQGIPVIHVTKIEEIAQRYGLPLQFEKMPPVGEGKIFIREEYSLLLVGGALGLILALMIGFLRLDLAFRLFVSSPQGSTGSPEQMV